MILFDGHKRVNDPKTFPKAITRKPTRAEAHMHYLAGTYTAEEMAVARFFDMPPRHARMILAQDPHVLDDARLDLAERQAAFDRMWCEEHGESAADLDPALATY